MFNLISKDILIQKKTLVIIVLFTFAENVLVHFVNGYPIMFISVLIPFAVEDLLLTNACSFDDKNKSYIVLNSLPVSRKRVVIARYLSVLLFFIIAVCIQLIFAALININKYGIMKVEYVVISFCFIIVLSSLYLPVYFKLGYEKTKYFIMILFFVMFFGGSFINEQSIIKIMKVFTNTPYWSLYIGGVLISIILMFLSLIISTVFYNSREFSE